MTFEDQLKSLTYYHLEEHTSGRLLLEALTDGKGAERPFVNQILELGQTSVTDREYQCHQSFDLIQDEGKSFICHIRKNTTKTILRQNSLPDNSIVSFDSVVILGCDTAIKTRKEVRLVAYTIEDTDYWIATNRFDLTADQIAEVQKLRWEIESLFAWWKRHLSVYHVLARSKYGLKVQIFTGLITYLLFAIFHQQHGEKMSIKRVRELRYQILNESCDNNPKSSQKHRAKKKRKRSPKT